MGTVFLVCPVCFRHLVVPCLSLSAFFLVKCPFLAPMVFHGFEYHDKYFHP